MCFPRREPPLPICRACDQQLLPAPRRGLTSRGASSEIRGNLTSRPGSAKESPFRHSSAGLSPPAELQHSLHAAGHIPSPRLWPRSAGGHVPGHPVCHRVLPPQPQPLSKRAFPKCCELLGVPALPGKIILLISFLFLRFVAIFLKVSWRFPSFAHPSLLPCQV